MREYGLPRIFEERIKGLLKASSAYFQRNPNQEAEAELERIADVARKYAARRNDIAHGIVRPFRWIILPSGESDPHERMQFCVVPPHYNGKKFDLTQSPNDLPDDVLGLVNNWVIYKIDEATIRRLKSYIPNSDESIWTLVRGLGPGQALLSFTHIRRPVIGAIDPSPAKSLMTE